MLRLGASPGSQWRSASAVIGLALLGAGVLAGVLLALVTLVFVSPRSPDDERIHFDVIRARALA